MSRKGNCLDNSMMESFFGLMKNELLYVNHFESLDRFETELKKYIAWYNTKRVKLRLKGMSPAQSVSYTHLKVLFIINCCNILANGVIYRSIS